MNDRIGLMTCFKRILILIVTIFITGCASSIPSGEVPKQVKQQDRKSKIAYNRTMEWLSIVKQTKSPVSLPKGTTIDSLKRTKKPKILQIYFSDQFSYFPLREQHIVTIYKEVREALGWRFRNYDVQLYSLELPIEELVPNIFRSNPAKYDRLRMPVLPENRPAPILRNTSKNLEPSQGLFGRNIVVWPSHGWYYNGREDVWEWQRPRLFQTVEDLLPYAFVIPYLEPMLENAGAQVFIPRERDLQMNEVVIDNDDAPTTGINPPLVSWSGTGASIWNEGDSCGLHYGRPPYLANFNPFGQGSQLIATTDSAVSGTMKWIPNLPETGEYAVYITYCATDSSTTEAHYRVRHSGGVTDFRVNQQIGGNTWLYLGKLNFSAGYDPTNGSVELLNDASQTGQMISADAVRFGGGMGMIMRKGRTSGRPKFVEGSRYYLQYIGMPNTLVYNLNGDNNDYKDDYQSRAEYANYLNGAPAGPSNHRAEKGLGIPIDISMAFHTDAGITGLDTTIGTLMIYSLTGTDSTRLFPGGMSRLANRDLADIMQSQIVRDIQMNFDSTWNRRNLMDALYSEAARPNMPGVLLELLSHQNFTDMKYASDPAFRFGVARAIYKGMLKYLSFQYKTAYVVQPLPIKKFEADLTDSNTVILKWAPEYDPLELTAVAKSYRVYMRLGATDFDNGIAVAGTQFETPKLEPGQIYSFRVTAVNEGGESFPSGTLGAAIPKAAKKCVGTALVVDGFDRVSGPATLEHGHFMGLANFIDVGVPDGIDINYTGEQYAFDPGETFATNTFPGHGASFADEEVLTRPGNTRDFVIIHGAALLQNGYAFGSATRDGWIMDSSLTHSYDLVDLILGEQRAIVNRSGFLKKVNSPRFQAFPKMLQYRIRKYSRSGGKLLITGAYVASDPLRSAFSDENSQAFAKNVLKMEWVSDHASRSGNVVVTDSSLASVIPSLSFNQGRTTNIYGVESPDALRGARGSITICRYSENQFSAGYFYKSSYRLVILGFPFETISPDQRSIFMGGLLNYFK